jgi:hypothetical protein
MITMPSSNDSFNLRSLDTPSSSRFAGWQLWGKPSCLLPVASLHCVLPGFAGQEGGGRRWVTWLKSLDMPHWPWLPLNTVFFIRKNGNQVTSLTPNLYMDLFLYFCQSFFFRWVKHMFFPMIICHNLGATFHLSGTKLPQLQVFVVLPAGPWHLGPTLPAEGAATISDLRAKRNHGW